jgi:hypothetical protein
VSNWHAPISAHPRSPAHHITMQDLAIFAGGLVFAMLIGIAATGILPR